LGPLLLTQIWPRTYSRPDDDDDDDDDDDASPLLL